MALPLPLRRALALGSVCLMAALVAGLAVLIALVTGLSIYRQVALGPSEPACVESVTVITDRDGRLSCPAGTALRSDVVPRGVRVTCSCPRPASLPTLLDASGLTDAPAPR